MFNRRKFVQSAGAFLGVATVAPTVALEVAKKTYSFSDVVGTVTDTEVTGFATAVVADCSLDAICYLSFICRKPGESDNELRSRFEATKSRG